jgi:hypothetical protein
MGEKLSKLKKRSGASYRSKRDNSLELFVDRCLGKNIRHRKIEIDAVLASDAYMLTFGQGDYTAQEMAEAFRLAFPKIRRSIVGFHPPLLARISKVGDLLIL